MAKYNDFGSRAKQRARLNFRFLWLKKDLLFKRNAKRNFPYDEYSSYL